MTIRATVAFDLGSVARLDRLSKHWGLTKSESLHRALERAEMAAVSPSEQGELPDLDEIVEMSPRQALEWLQAHPMVTKDEGERWRNELRQTREDFAKRP